LNGILGFQFSIRADDDPTGRTLERIVAPIELVSDAQYQPTDTNLIAPFFERRSQITYPSEHALRERGHRPKTSEPQSTHLAIRHRSVQGSVFK
jgi:hypothetical protein